MGIQMGRQKFYRSLGLEECQIEGKLDEIIAQASSYEHEYMEEQLRLEDEEKRKVFDDLRQRVVKAHDLEEYHHMLSVLNVFALPDVVAKLERDGLVVARGKELARMKPRRCCTSTPKAIETKLAVANTRVPYCPYTSYNKASWDLP